METQSQPRYPLAYLSGTDSPIGTVSGLSITPCTFNAIARLFVVLLSVSKTPGFLKAHNTPLCG